MHQRLSSALNRIRTKGNTKRHHGSRSEADGNATSSNEPSIAEPSPSQAESHAPSTQRTASPADSPTAARSQSQTNPEVVSTQTKIPQDEGMNESPSLWKQAYDKLDVELVKKYEKLLLEEFPTSSSVPISKNGNQNRDSSVGDANQISSEPVVPRDRLDEILRRAKKRMEEKITVYHIAGQDFNPKENVAKAVEFVLWAKALVDQAVRPSAEASLIWVGACLVIPLFVQPYLVEQEHKSGFEYVTCRMEFYAALEPRWSSEKMNMPEEQRNAVQKDIVDLYQHVLSFQLKTVLRLHQHKMQRWLRDVTNQSAWSEMLSRVKEAEEILHKDFDLIKGLDLREKLEEIDQKTKSTAEKMSELLTKACEQYHVAQEQLEQTKRTNQILDESLGEIELPTDRNAEYDPHSSACQEGTRKSILDEINAWENTTDSKNLFWLHGPAGTGKSTVAMTTAGYLDNKGLLGASYFFSTEKKGLNRVNRFFPTIARQLMHSIPGFAECLRNSLKQHGNPKTEAAEIEMVRPEEQFRRLILVPISATANNMSEILTRVILIDGLDEVGDEEIVDMICHRLTTLCKVPKIRLLVFLSTRHSKAITIALEKAEYHQLSMLKFPDETKEDIFAFLSTSFKAIKNKYDIAENPWPRSEVLERLLRLAVTPSPLFIYAATLCRFVDDRIDLPKAQLDTWLQHADKNENTTSMNSVYRLIIERLLFVYKEGQQPRPITDGYRSKLLQILGAIILLAAPLPAMSLSALLDLTPDEFNIPTQRKLHAVLDIPSDGQAPIRILHKSFSDFLLGSEGTGIDGFRLNAAETHAILASKCINRMKSKRSGLQRDICNIKDDTKPRENINESIIRNSILPDLEYACLNWVYHLQHCSRNTSVADEIGLGIRDEDILAFLKVHFLHWLEALGWRGAMPHCHSLIDTLRSLIMPEHTDALEFLSDAKWFVLQNRAVVDMAPLQLYSSAIIFAPEMSIVRNTFKDQIPRCIHTLPTTEPTWTPEIQRLKGHTDWLLAFAFSPDGRIASTSKDESVRIWNPATGKELLRLDGVTDQPMAATFSPNGSVIAASDDKTVRLWNLTTGDVRQLHGHIQTVKTIIFLQDGKSLASASDNAVRIWNLESGEVQQLDDSTGWIAAVAFSPDGKLLASLLEDRIVRVWNLETVEIRQLDSPTSLVRAIAFSPDGKLIASAPEIDSVRLWNLETWEVQQLEGHVASVRTIAFSPDGKLLALGSADGIIRLLDLATGKIQQFTGHTGWVTNVAFSLDSKLLASSSDDGTIRLWNLDFEGEMKQREGHSKRVTTVKFSPDGKLLASLSDDQTIRLWNTEKSTHIRQLEGNTKWTSAVLFSPNSKFLVSSKSKQPILRLWDTESGKEVQQLKGHKNRIIAAIFSADSQLLVSSSDDETVRLWNLAEGNAVHVVTLSGVVREMAFSLDGKLETDKGVLDIDYSIPPVSSTPTSTTPKVLVEENWLVGPPQTLQDSQTLIWLPPEYRETYDTWEDIVALGCSSGQVLFIRFR